MNNQSIALSNRVNIKPLFGNGALVWFGTPHVEGHTMRENPDLFEAEGLVAPRAFSLISDYKIG